MASWVGNKMKNPQGKVGKVIEDDNGGWCRYLTVKFPDGTIEILTLSNVGNNSTYTNRWSWQHNGKWVRWSNGGF